MPRTLKAVQDTAPLPDTPAANTPQPALSPPQIEKGVPLPVGRSGAGKYPWRQMEVGDSFFVPSATLAKFSTSRKYAEGQTGFKFAIRTVGMGVRIWRIALLLLALTAPLHAQPAADHAALSTPAATPASDTPTPALPAVIAAQAEHCGFSNCHKA